MKYGRFRGLRTGTTCVSGHLAYTKEYHVCQLIEGKAAYIEILMRKILKDPRVTVHKVFRRNLRTMNLDWNMSMCYTFELTTEQFEMITDDDVSLDQMFNSMKNSYEVRREGWKLSELYKTIVETFLLKYVSMKEKLKFKRVGT